MISARRGDLGAYDEIYSRFSRFVHALLVARVRPEDAGDLTQDVFLHAWTTLHTLREPAAFGGWIGAIARRRAIDHLRRRPADIQLRFDRANRDAPDITAEAIEAIAAIHQLPDAYRETLTLRLVEGHSGPEIAELTGLTPDSVRVNLHRGFKLLRERLGQRP